MKKLSVFPLLAALAFFVSCQKQQTEEERKAEVERQVQDRLAAERADAEKKRIAEDQAKLDAREKALADREAAAASPTAVAEEPAAPPAEEVVTERSDRAEPRSTAAYGMFYEKLDSYGEWRETSDYGYVFQPREAETSRDWRPYTEGHWVYSDAGWTWVSEEPFGWATYHYGRWVKLRRVGWVWVPGNEWAPAWVSWRSSKDYVGWAPLPPEARFDRKSGIQNWADSYYDIGPDQYSFVPANEFGAEHLRRAVVPTERNTTIVIETNNVTRLTFANSVIVNEGPSYEELRSRSQRPIERYRLRREHNFEGPPRVSGAELQISVPILSEVHNVFRPRRVKERVTEVNVDNGWTSVSDRSAAERARTKIRAEATPPPNAPPKKFVPPATTTASATPASTVAASPAATATTAPSAAPVHSATPTPAPTTATAASATPVATASPRRVRPTPSIAPSPTTPPASSPEPSATAAAASPTPVTTASPRRVRPTPSIAPSPTAAPASSPETSASAPAATVTPAAQASPSASVRPSRSIPPRTMPTPRPSASLPMVPPRTTPPVVSTPAPTAPPAETTESAAKPLPTSTPVRRQPLPPRTLPSPSVAPELSDAPRQPRDLPRRTLPPQRMTPPPVTTPATATTPATTPATSPETTPALAPSAPPPADARRKNRPLPRPTPPAQESSTPTPAPSTPPN